MYSQIRNISIACILVLALGMTSTSYAAEDTWTYKAYMPTARTWVGGCVIDGKIYVIGGALTESSVTSAVEVYDPIVDTWTKLANMPSARCLHATCTLGGKIYVFGGVSPGVFSTAKKNVYVYDPKVDTWTQKADMPYANAACGIAVVDSTIYLIGGSLSESNPPVPTVMAYNPVMESWTQKADMPTARYNLSACVVDGKIYAIGGCTEDWRSFSYKHVEVYDPSTNTWTRKSDMPTQRWSLGTCVVDGKIYAIGGTDTGDVSTGANEVYDPATDTWTTKSPMQQKQHGHFLGSIGDKIYVIGGHYPNLIMVTKMEEYDTGLGVPSPDFNSDGIVDATDMCIMVDHWGEDYPLCDIAPPPFGDGIVDVQDLIVLAEHLFEDDRLIAHWKMDEIEGNIAYDSVGVNDGVLNSVPIWQPDGGMVAGALQFDGIDDYIETDFVLNQANGAFSVFAWIKGGAPGEVIISQADTYITIPVQIMTDPGSVWLVVDPNHGRLMTGFMDTMFGPLESDSIITDGQWHHIGLVFDCIAMNRHLYLDGTEVAVDAGFVGGAHTTGALYIGTGPALDANTFFSGLIDDVRIYDAALSAKQIEALAR